jgi:hypothetical protein
MLSTAHRTRYSREVVASSPKMGLGSHRFYRSVGYEAMGYRFYKEL